MDTDNQTDTGNMDQRYLLKILEVSGKSVTQKYIDVVKYKLDEMKLKYSIDIIIDENLLKHAEHNNLQYGGGNTTYPYRMFEAAIDSILPDMKSQQSWLTTKHEQIKSSREQRQGFFDTLFSYKPLNDDINKEVIANEESGIDDKHIGDEPFLDEPSSNVVSTITTPATTENSYTMSSLPSDYDGIIQIQVTVYNQPGSTSLVLGIHELNILVKDN